MCSHQTDVVITFQNRPLLKSDSLASLDRDCCTDCVGRQLAGLHQHTRNSVMPTEHRRLSVARPIAPDRQVRQSV